MHFLPKLAISALCTLLAACASSTVQRTGTTSYAQLPASSDVAVFMAESEVKQSFEVVANISYSDPGKYQVLGLSDTFEPLKAKAREVGANGVIVDRSETIISGIISRGISVQARAIRFEPVKPATSSSDHAAVSLSPDSSSAKDAAEALRQLRQLHDERVINDQEFEKKKAEILQRM